VRDWALPGSELVLPWIAHSRIHAPVTALAGALDRIGLRARPDLAEVARGYGSLADADTRRAFIHTLRSVVDPTGQRVDATDRLYLTEGIPALIVWGRRDPLIPVSHADIAHRTMPGSRLEVLEESGHFPQVDAPVRFARLLGDFIDSTEPAELSADSVRERVLAEARAARDHAAATPQASAGGGASRPA